MTYTREDDLVIALQEATTAMSATDRFDEIARVNGDQEAARRVTKVADVYVAWLRRVKSATLTVVAIEEIDTGEVVTTPGEGASGMTNIDTSQRVRYVLTAKDDRGFETDGELGARVSTEGVVTLVVTQATEGTPSGKDEAVATFAGLGTTTVEVFDTANPEVVLAADVIVANPGAVAAAEMTGTVEEIPAPEPEPEPAPEA